MARVVATFNETTAWAGRVVSLEGDHLTLQDHGPISAEDLLRYDRQGQLTWSELEVREWVQQRAEHDRQMGGAPVTPAGRPGPAMRTAKAPGGGRRVLGLPVWAIVVGGVGILFVLLVILGAIGAAVDSSSPEKTANKPAAASTAAQASPSPSPSPTPTPSLKDRLAEAFDKAHKGFVKVDLRGGDVTVIYNTHDMDFWDEDDLIATLATDSVNVLAAGFSDPEVKSVDIVWKVDMTDSYGKTTSEKGVEILWKRTTWKHVSSPQDLVDRLTGDEASMYGTLSNYYYIHPGIWKKTKLPDMGIPVEGIR